MQGHWNRWTEDNEADTGDPLDSERRLLASMLIEAMRDYVNKMDTDDRREARRWIASRSQAPFGYEWVCDMLELDAERIRLLLEQRGGHVYRSLFNRKKMASTDRSKLNMQNKIAKLEAEATRLRAALDGVGDTSH